MSMDDEDIIELLNARDESGLAALQQKYGQACLTLARDVTGNRSDAEEVVNDVSLRVWNSIPPAHPQSLKRYVLRVTRNVALDRWRECRADKRGGEQAVITNELDECAVPAEVGNTDAGEQALRDSVEEFVAGLDREERAIFLLRYWHGKPVSDIARAFGLLPNTVTVRLRRTRDKLRAFLTERGIQV